jgi:hypothetical protein
MNTDVHQIVRLHSISPVIPTPSFTAKDTASNPNSYLLWSLICLLQSKPGPHPFLDFPDLDYLELSGQLFVSAAQLGFVWCFIMTTFLRPRGFCCIPMTSRQGWSPCSLGQDGVCWTSPGWNDCVLFVRTHILWGTNVFHAVLGMKPRAWPRPQPLFVYSQLWRRMHSRFIWWILIC